MRITALSTAVLGAFMAINAEALELELTHTKVWTYAHGVTTPLWDHVFGTPPQKRTR